MTGVHHFHGYSLQPLPQTSPYYYFHCCCCCPPQAWSRQGGCHCERRKAVVGGKPFEAEGEVAGGEGVGVVGEGLKGCCPQ
jgi:hypothetical protein